MLSFCVDSSRCGIETAQFNGLNITRSFARLPGSSTSPSTLRTKMDDANWELFFFFLSCQHVLSRFWRGFPCVGIQRCTTLLIRLFCHVPLHLSWAYCSGEREREEERERHSERMLGEGQLLPNTCTACTRLSNSQCEMLSFNDGYPNAKHVKYRGQAHLLMAVLKSD